MHDTVKLVRAISLFLLARNGYYRLDLNYIVNLVKVHVLFAENETF